MRKTAIMGAALLAAVSIAAGCTRRTPAPPAGTDATDANANATADGGASQPSPSPATAAAVTFVGLRDKVIAGQPFEVTWRVEPPSGSATISHTAIHSDTTSHPGDLGTDVGPAAAGYKELTPDYAKGEFQVPRAFTVQLAPQAGTLYLRAHAIIDGMNYWTAEQAVAVAAEPQPMGEGEGPGKLPEREGFAPAVKTFNVTAKQWSFTPSSMTVKKGDRVKLIVRSVDVKHGLKLPEFGIDQPLEPGKTATVEFVAGKTGTFTFSCNVQCGEGHGEMRGTLVVEE